MNLQDKICIVTGANSGIGYGAALSLAAQGAQVLMICRNSQRGTVAQAQLRAHTQNAKIDLLIADLASQKDIRHLADKISSNYPQVDILINNAAIVPPHRQVTSEGIEMQLAVNTLAPLLLTELLLPALQSSSDGRIVNLSALMSKSLLKPRFHDLQSEKLYTLRGWRTYQHTKIWLSLITLGFVHRLENTSMRVVGVHPGVVNTNILKVGGVLRWIWQTIGLTPEQSGEHIVQIASMNDLPHGYYFDTNGKSVKMSDYYDKETIDKAWETCQGLIHSGEN